MEKPITVCFSFLLLLLLDIRVFPPFQFNISLPAKKTAKDVTKVFTIYPGNVSQPLMFFIVNITSTGIVTPTNISWKELSLQITNVDCDALKLYPEPRSHFCIDRMSGIVYLSAYFKLRNPPENTKYKILIRIQNEITNTSIQQIYTVNIIANCSSATEHYKKLLDGTYIAKSCQSGIASINTIVSNSGATFTAKKRTYIVGFSVQSFNRGTTHFFLQIRRQSKPEYYSKIQDVSQTNVSVSLFVNIGETLIINTFEIMGKYRSITKPMVVTYYMSDLTLCRKKDNCRQLYESWITSLTQFTNTSKCVYDSQLVGSYFGRCKCKYTFM